MHVADIDGRIYERKKRERRREPAYAAWCALAMTITLVLLVWGCQ